MDAIVSGLLETLATLAAGEWSLLRGLRGEIQKLQGDLDMIKAVLTDAEDRRYLDAPVQIWLRELRDVTYDAVDVFDELKMVAASHPKLMSDGDNGITKGSIRVVSGCFLSCFTDTPNPILFRHQMGSRIKDVKAKLSELKERTHGLLGPIGQRNQPESSEMRETISTPDEDLTLLGREVHKQKVLEILFAPSDDGVPLLVPIVGIGGVGKTTLAQAVYNDDRVGEYFEMRKWVFVGEKFDGRKVIEDLLSVSSKKEIAGTKPTLDYICGCLISEIRDKRFLIVLDVVWSENSQEWDQIWGPLKCGGRGAKVIVTTRSQEVAKMRGPAPSTVTLEPLSDDDCLSIFEEYAFVGVKPERFPNLREIGKLIVRKLEGLPLAAKLIGGALGRNREETYWRRLMDSEIWLQNLNKQGVLPSLLLSYQALPSHLKPCFEFCSLFPKDYQFDRIDLVWMWMAHDLVEPVGGERMEDVGDRYFDELLDRSFFQCIDNSYVMHDLIHDLAEFVSKDECLRVEDMQKSYSSPGSLHHLSVYLDKDPESKPKDQFNRIRTLLHFRGWESITSDRIACRLFGQLRCIRLLDLHRCRSVKSLPKCIGDLKHLRYLDIRETWVSRLPESLCRLYNLQTLIVDDDCRLPRGMSKLVNLRNLQAGEDAISGISGIGKLTCLQELRGPFKVSMKEKGHGIGELKGMNQLRGTLGIKNLDRVANAEEAAGFQLRDKVFLDRLELMWDGGQSDVEQVIEALQPPQQLKGVKLGGYPGPRAPSWMTQDPPLLSKLASVDLCDCKNWRCLPSELGRLPCLRSLGIKGMDGVKQVGPEFHCCSGEVLFPCLEELRLCFMGGWEGWVGREAGVEQCFFCFPRLRKLQIDGCPKLATISCLLGSHRLESLEQLLISECEELVRLLRDGEEEGEQNPHSPHSCHLRMVQGIFIANCPKLPWSELESILTLTSSSLRALCISSSTFYKYSDGEFLLAKSNTTTTVAAAAKGMPLEYLQTDRMELLSWLLQPGRSLGSLTRLVIEECKELTVFTEEEEDGWLRNLPSLRFLKFEGCANLRCLPAGLHRLSSLQQLYVEKCGQIQALPEHLSSLQEMHIKSCDQIRALRVTPSLRKMSIRGCPLLEEVTWLEMEDSIAPAPTPPPPVQLESVYTDNRRLLSWLLLQPRSLHALQQLVISHCRELESFTEEETVGWRRNLPSLQQVTFGLCPELRSLPEGLHITPRILDCPKLGRSRQCFPTWFRN